MCVYKYAPRDGNILFAMRGQWLGFWEAHSVLVWPNRFKGFNAQDRSWTELVENYWPNLEANNVTASKGFETITNEHG